MVVTRDTILVFFIKVGQICSSIIATYGFKSCTFKPIMEVYGLSFEGEKQRITFSERNII